MLTDAMPRLRFAHLPTPIEMLGRLSQRLGGPRLLIKRDDQTGLVTGGNKTRKLEFLVAEAQAQEADTLVTGGAVQSNHCRQTAAAAARHGLACVLALRGDPPTGAPSGNLLLDLLMGAEPRFDSRPASKTLPEVVESLRAEGRRPYLVPYGGSNPVGTTGYVAAMEELVNQLQERDERVDHVVLASSSGGTQAGLALGARALGFEGQIVGISVAPPAGALRQDLAALANATAAHLNLDLAFVADDLVVNDDYVGAGYGMMGELERNAIRTLAETEGILLDPVYTGRAFGGLLDLVEKGAFGQDETVLFWHTGGTPALFSSRYGEMLV
jgi:D-cysteine desulfhydrase